MPGSFGDTTSVESLAAGPLTSIGLMGFKFRVWFVDLGLRVWGFGGLGDGEFL